MFEDVDRPEAPAAVPRWLRGVERAVALATAALLGSLVCITVIDVAGRYLMNRPLAGAAEWVELAMGLMIFGGMFQAAARSEHIRIDLLDQVWSPAALHRLLNLARFASAGLLAFLGWRLWGKGREMAEFADVSSYLGVPLAPIAFTMTAACILAALAYVLDSSGAAVAVNASTNAATLDPEGENA